MTIRIDNSHRDGRHHSPHTSLISRGTICESCDDDDEDEYDDPADRWKKAGNPCLDNPNPMTRYDILHASDDENNVPTLTTLRRITSTTAMCIAITCAGALATGQLLHIQSRKTTPTLSAKNNPRPISPMKEYTITQLQNIFNLPPNDDTSKPPSFPSMRAVNSTPSFLRDTPFPSLRPTNSPYPRRQQ